MITQNLSAEYQSRKATLSKGFAGSESDKWHLVMITATKHNLALKLLGNVPSTHICSVAV